MEKINDNYKFVNKTKKVDELIDLFYDQMNNEETLNSFPLCIKIVNKIKRLKTNLNDEEKLLELQLRNLYVFAMGEINRTMNYLKYQSDNGMTPEQVNKRFYLGLELFDINGYDQESKDYICKNMVLDIFYNTFPKHKFDIEKDLHTNYRTKEELLKKGINKAVIDIIKNYDPNLSNYITCHINTLDNVKELMKDMLDNFDKFEEENETRRYNNIINEVRDYSNEYNINSEEYLLRLAAENNILDKIIKYSNEYLDQDYLYIKEYIISVSRSEKDIHYLKLDKNVKNYLKERVADERDWYLKDTDEEYLKKKLDVYLNNFKNMTDEEQLENVFIILDEIETTEEQDKVIKYINNNLKDSNVLKFKPKKGN